MRTLFWRPTFHGTKQSVRLLNGTSARYKLFSAMKSWLTVETDKTSNNNNNDGDDDDDLFSWTTWVSRYRKGKTSQNLNEARYDRVLGWQWH